MVVILYLSRHQVYSHSKIIFKEICIFGVVVKIGKNNNLEYSKFIARQCLDHLLLVQCYVKLLFLFVVRAIRVKFASCLLMTNVRLCESGGIGRRAGFRFQWGNP